MGFIKLNSIGLEVESSNNLSKMLNLLLSNYQVFQMNVRGFHWNLKGDFFFEMHEVFGNLYNDLNAKSDEIAERIATLEKVPVHSFEDYLNLSEIQPVKNIKDAKIAAASILEGLDVIIDLERNIAIICKDLEDRGTLFLMESYLKEQEKQVWMFQSFLGK